MSEKVLVDREAVERVMREDGLPLGVALIFCATPVPDEITTLRQQLADAEQSCRARIKADRLYCLEHGDEAAQEMAKQLRESQARVAELENGLEGIANCAYGYSHPKAQTADEAASWMNGEAMRLLGEYNSKAFLLRVQAEAVVPAMMVTAREFGRPDITYSAMRIFAEDYAQRLRTQADQLERGEGDE